MRNEIVFSVAASNRFLQAHFSAKNDEETKFSAPNLEYSIAPVSCHVLCCDKKYFSNYNDPT
jgi:hypothetical protein